MQGDSSAMLYSHGILDVSTLTQPQGFGYYIHTDGQLLLPPQLEVNNVVVKIYGKIGGVSNVTLIENGVGSLTLGSTGSSIGNTRFVLNALNIQNNNILYFENNNLTNPVTVQVNTMTVDNRVSGIYLTFQLSLCFIPFPLCFLLR